VLEVETPILCRHSVTDPFIQSIPALYQPLGSKQEFRHYLQTSPEYAMKRLLAAGSGSIYQITKAFRQGEVGRHHNPEFTMLEWYRIGFDHHRLMDEMDELLQLVLHTPKAIRKSYSDVFNELLGIDPHVAEVSELKACALAHGVQVQTEVEDKATWLDLLFSHCIEPELSIEAPTFIYDFPLCQAALARLQPGNPPVASRFEVYFRGIELANGFHELADANEQRTRFEKNRQQRLLQHLVPMEIDEFFLDALQQGLPDCAGVALGIDRLIMLALNANHIKEIISFSFENC